MGKIEFKNLTVIYDNQNEYSNEKLNKTRIIDNVIGMILGLLIVFAIIAIAVSKTPVVVLGIVLALAVVCTIIVYKMYKRIHSVHYDLITWLLRLETKDLEAGWFNNRYIVICWTTNGWIVNSLKGFLNADKYTVIENCVDKNRPIHLTVDTTKDTIEVIVENKEDIK